jgi:KRAB domain-containing zinc finger protein
LLKFKPVSKMSRDSEHLVMNIKTEEVDSEYEPAASSSNEATREVKIEPERQWLLCLGSDEIKKEPLGRTCEKCERVTMVKNHKCETRCKICNKKLRTKHVLINHMQRVHRAEPDCEFFECDFCGMRFQHKYFIVKHLKLRHEGGKFKDFQCDYDGKSFTLKNGIFTHMRDCHRAATKCKFCGKELKDMKKHIRVMHPVKKITVACKICDKTFKREFSLALHMKSHNKQFECRFCNQKYPTGYHLKAHLRLHDNPQAFQCKICFKNFQNLSNLKQHVKIHDTNRIKLYQCEHCDYATDTKSCLKKHLKVHIKIRIKDLKCTKCDHATDLKSSLKRHIATMHDKKKIVN